MGNVDIIYVLPDIVDLLLWYWCFILCCTCRSVKIIRKFPFLYDRYGCDSTVVFSVCKSHSYEYHLWNASCIGYWFLADRLSGICSDTKLFPENSGRYRRVFHYFREYWPLVLTNFLYTLGLYIHNFVFWTTDLHMVIARSFVCVTTYDMATCLAMFTNISASVIFISRVEMNFHERYKAYSEAVIGGRSRY